MVATTKYLPADFGLDKCSVTDLYAFACPINHKPPEGASLISPKPALPTADTDRKALPLYDFMFKYFPLAWLEVVKVAVVGNEQHNPGEPLHWAREKSTDQLNCAFRHIFDHGMGHPLDKDGCYHLAKAIWRHMAELQLICEKKAARPFEYDQQQLASESFGNPTGLPL